MKLFLRGEISCETLSQILIRLSEINFSLNLTLSGQAAVGQGWSAQALAFDRCDPHT